MSPAIPGYQAPAVTVSSSLPKRKADKAVLIVPVVSGGDDDAKATVVASPFLDAEAVGEIEVALESLGAKGGSEQVTRVVAPSLPVGSVLAVVNAGAQLTALVPDTLWVIANMKETQMAEVRLGQPVRFTVDALNNAVLRGHVERIAPATGSEFSVITPDNATGNFVKIAQRIPVRISIDPNQPLARRLRPGMSVVATIDTAPANREAR